MYIYIYINMDGNIHIYTSSYELETAYEMRCLFRFKQRPPRINKAMH